MAMEKDLEEFKALMEGAMKTGVVQQVMQTYDQFATAALTVLVQREAVDLTDCSDEETKELSKNIARVAWTLADAMMEERKNRGLGGFNS